MADQDFNIKVVTTADTAGIREVDAGLDKIARRQAEAEAKWARSPINPINQRGGGIAALGGGPTSPASGGDEDAGFRGTSIGLGTIITLLTAGISKWRQFNHEQDLWVEGMIRAEEKARELGESIIAIQDAAISAKLHGTDSLEESFTHLNQEIIRLKTEQSELNLPEQGEEWKKLNSEVLKNESLLKGVESALQKQRDSAKQKAQSELEKRVPGLKPEDQIKEADAQTQAILKNEQAAARARAEGNERDADLFQKSADQYKASATPKQLADLQRIHDLQDQLAGKTIPGPTRQPEPGEPGGGEVGTGGEYRKSSAQRRADQAQNKKDREAGIEQTRQEGIEAQEARDSDLKDMNKIIRSIGGKPITEAQKQQFDLKQAIDDLGTKFDRYWG